MAREEDLLTVKGNLAEALSLINTRKGSDPIFSILFQNLINPYAFILAEYAALVDIECKPEAPTNTGSPKLPPCVMCADDEQSKGMSIQFGYKFCPICGRQLRASA